MFSAAKVSLISIDPLELNRTILCRHLKQLGLDPITAANGSDALELLRGGCGCDVIFVDHTLPDMTAEDMAGALRDARIALPVILMSVQGDVSSDLFSGFLAKPLTRTGLFAQLDSWKNLMASPCEAAPVAAECEAGPALRSMRILAAEDNKTNRLVLRPRSGSSVLAAASAGR